jgi:hypothetical protein
MVASCGRARRYGCVTETLKTVPWRSARFRAVYCRQHVAQADCIASSGVHRPSDDARRFSRCQLVWLMRCTLHLGIFNLTHAGQSSRNGHWYHQWHRRRYVDLSRVCCGTTAGAGAVSDTLANLLFACAVPVCVQGARWNASAACRRPCHRTACSIDPHPTLISFISAHAPPAAAAHDTLHGSTRRWRRRPKPS